MTSLEKEFRSELNAILGYEGTGLEKVAVSATGLAMKSFIAKHLAKLLRMRARVENWAIRNTPGA